MSLDLCNMFRAIKSFHHQLRTLLNRQKTKESNSNSESDFAALFYIRNTNIELDKDLAVVLKMVIDLEHCCTKIRLLLNAASPNKENMHWETLVEDISDHLSEIGAQLKYLKDNMLQNTTLNASLFWQQTENLIEDLTSAYQKLEVIGFEILPEEQKKYWKLGICDVQNETFQSAVSRIVMCRQQFDFIKKFTPHVENKRMQTIIRDTPIHYSLDEARKYKLNYHSAEI